jgi:hypothetical protein
MDRKELKLGCLYHLVWANGGENIMLAVETPQTSYLYKVEKSFLEPLAHFGNGSFCTGENGYELFKSTAIYPVWNNLKSFEKIEHSELPLYISWEHNAKFEEILKG